MTFPMDYGWFLRTNDLHLNREEIYSKADLHINPSNSVNYRITTEEFYRIFEAVQDFFPDKTFALEFEKVWTVESFSLIHYAILHSRNLKECFERYQRYEYIYGPEEINITENNNEFTICIDFLPSVFDVPSILIEFIFICLIKLARLGTRRILKPISVVTTADMNTEAYNNYFGVYPQKGEFNRLVFSKEDAEYPFITFDENIWKMHEKALQNSLDQLNNNISLTAKVQSAILQLMSSGKCSIEDIAKKLNVSKRTLQRNLKAESTNFLEQLNGVRKERALYFLEKTDLSCDEIADRLGYEYPNSFSRAFTKWTGMNPQSLRNADKH